MGTEGTRVVWQFIPESHSHLGMTGVKMGHKSSEFLYDHRERNLYTSNWVVDLPGSLYLKEWLFNCLCVAIHVSMTNKPKNRDLGEKEIAL